MSNQETTHNVWRNASAETFFFQDNAHPEQGWLAQKTAGKWFCHVRTVDDPDVSGLMKTGELIELPESKMPSHKELVPYRVVWMGTIGFCEKIWGLLG